MELTKYSEAKDKKMKEKKWKIGKNHLKNGVICVFFV